MSLSSQQDILPSSVPFVPRYGAWSSPPLATGQTGSVTCCTIPTTLCCAWHRWYVLHSWFQWQSEFPPHSIAIIPELLRGGTVQNTDLKEWWICPKLSKHYESLSNLCGSIVVPNLQLPICRTNYLVVCE